MRTSFAQKIISGLLLISTILSVFLVYPFKTQALIVFDPTNLGQNTITAGSTAISAGADTVTSTNTTFDNIQKYVIKPLAIAAAQAAIRSITQSIVNWINSGFKGSPAFATDLQRNLRQLGDGVAAAFVNELINNTSINSPYLQRALHTVAQGYLLYTSRDYIATQLRSTLNEYSQNEEAFRRGQFNEGGFNAWFHVTRSCGEDPFCVEQRARDELVRRIDEQTRQRLEELDWGRGFLSWKDCPVTEQVGDDPTTVVGSTRDFGETSLTDAEESFGCTIKTPGTILAGSMEFLATQPALQLTVAESFDQIIGALASQLVSKVFSATGLLDSTQPASGGGRAALTGFVNQQSATAGLVAGFSFNVATERTNTIKNQKLWEDFKTKIDEATEKCALDSSNVLKKEQVAAIKTEADTMLARAPETIQNLTEILDELEKLPQERNAVYSAAAAQLTSRYNQILASGSVSAPSETMKVQINDIITNGCN